MTVLKVSFIARPDVISDEFFHVIGDELLRFDFDSLVQVELLEFGRSADLLFEYGMRKLAR